MSVVARTVLWGAILAAFAFPLTYPALTVDDSPSYLNPARSWARGNGLLEANGAPLQQRLPLYPLTLGLTIRLAGDDPRTLGLLNAGLHVAAILVVRSALPMGALRDLISGLAIVYPPLLTSSGLVLQESLLAPTLGVQDPRTDKRIEFIGGIRGTAELERLVDAGKAAVAFSLHPTSVDELMNISDAGEIMPPKSTWFEPKLRDGLLSHLI